MEGDYAQAMNGLVVSKTVVLFMPALIFWAGLSSEGIMYPSP